MPAKKNRPNILLLPSEVYAAYFGKDQHGCFDTIRNCITIPAKNYRGRGKKVDSLPCIEELANLRHEIEHYRGGKEIKAEIQCLAFLKKHGVPKTHSVFDFAKRLIDYDYPTSTFATELWLIEGLSKCIQSLQNLKHCSNDPKVLEKEESRLRTKYDQLTLDSLTTNDPSKLTGNILWQLKKNQKTTSSANKPTTTST